MELHPHLIQFKNHIEDFPKNGVLLRKKFMNYHLDRLEGASTRLREFSYCQFNRRLVIDSNYQYRFDNCVFIEGIRLSVFSGELTFTDCSFIHCNIDYKSPHEGAQFYFDNCSFSGEQLVIKNSAEFSNCHINVLNLSESINSLSVKAKSKISSFKFEEGSRLSSFFIDDSEITDLKCDVGFIGASELKFANSEINTLAVFNAPVEMSISSIRSENMEFCNIRNDQKLYISSCIAKSVVIEPAYGKSIVKIWDNTFSKLKLSSFGEEVDVRVFKIYGLKSLCLQFVKCKSLFLSEIQVNEIKIRNTDFETWQIGYIDWGKSFSLKLSEDIADNRTVTNKYLELMEINRRFKQYFKMKDSPIDAAIFQRNELQAYLRYLLHKWNRLSFSQFFDLTLLGTNRIFSNFGQSFILPLLWLLSIHFYLFYLLNQNYQLGYDLCFDWDSGCSFSKEAFGYYLHLINPVHKLVDVNGESVIAVEDFIMRISSGYFIFYFLKATRKFSR
ncbi:hypothetical protein [Marinoscillum pacificum]|uniref:hypothetical protein n=1 Tax=Marinoscillum pacificum TaxID=392723 RepID=UPI0021587459|nr:hypothetical protein [Marinoscillum pacificum]